MRHEIEELEAAKSKVNKIVELLVENTLRNRCTACKFVDKADENLERCLYCGCDGESSNFEMNKEAFELAKSLIYEAASKTGDRR